MDEYPMINRKAVSVSVAAELVGLSETKVRQLIHAGEFPARRVGKRFIVPIAALDQWLTEDGTDETN